ncbi:MAG: hypothetical protein IJH39_10575 [Clostridia bacterium]|nr:hypothetical protein [Clostridia bacterium]
MNSVEIKVNLCYSSSTKEGVKMSRKDNYIEDENYVPKAFKKTKKPKEIDFEEGLHKTKRRHEAKRNKKINIKRNRYKENKHKESYNVYNYSYNFSISY